MSELREVEMNGVNVMVTAAQYQRMTGDKTCTRCRKREGTIKWGDALAMTHGGGELRCELCVVEVQLEHARERAAKIPELEARLAELSASPTPDAEEE